VDDARGTIDLKMGSGYAGPWPAALVEEEPPATRVSRVITYDRYRDDRDEITSGLAAEHEYALVPSADDPPVMAGAGTVALELLRQAPSLALILVPVGGGPAALGGQQGAPR
jgi:threonine dehydratase